MENRGRTQYEKIIEPQNKEIKTLLPLVFKFDFVYICKEIIIETLVDGIYRLSKSIEQGAAS